MKVLMYVVSAGLLLAAGFIVFRYIVPNDYQKRGQLGWFASGMQLVIFTGFFFFPYIYMPPEWSWDWLPNGTWNRMTALILVVLGMVMAFGTMAWFGIRRAFGFEVTEVIRTGPYRFSRNPQMLGGWLMVIGVFIYLPSLYNLGWVVTWGLIGHWMVSAEEAHLRNVFGEEYERYCEETPRYLLK